MLCVGLAAGCARRADKWDEGPANFSCPRELVGPVSAGDTDLIGVSAADVLAGLQLGPLDGSFTPAQPDRDPFSTIPARLTFRFIPDGPALGFRDVAGERRPPEALCPWGNHLEWRGVMFVDVYAAGHDPFTLALDDARAWSTGPSPEQTRVRAAGGRVDEAWLNELAATSRAPPFRTGVPFSLMASRLDLPWTEHTLSFSVVQPAHWGVWATWTALALDP